MPSKKAIFCKWLLKILCCIEHHFHNTFDIPISRNTTGNFYPQAMGQ